MGLELVFRHIPGKSLQRRPNVRSAGFIAHVHNAIADAVVGVSPAPARLRPRPSCSLALRLPARALPLAHPRVRPEPASATAALVFPRPAAGHAPSLASPALGRPILSVAHPWTDSAEQGRVVSGERLSARAVQRAGGRVGRASTASSRPLVPTSTLGFARTGNPRRRTPRNPTRTTSSRSCWKAACDLVPNDRCGAGGSHV